VSPTTIVVGVNASALTLKASDGRLNWSITESSSLIGHVTVFPASGTLAAGQSTTVTVRASGLLGGLRAAAAAGGGGGGGGGGACVDCTLTVNPGGITVTVILDISIGSSSGPPPDDASPLGLVGRLVN
jgi:hypothetical protein